MALWGKTGAATKPGTSKYAKREVYANTKGWVQPAQGNGNASAQEEVLVCIKGLSSAVSATTGTGLAQANITSINWNISEWSRAAGGTLSVTANWDENVTVTGTPRLTVVNDSRSNHTLSYASGTGSNRLTFTLVIGAAAGAIHATDVLSVGANAMAHNGGSTTKDAGTNVTSTITTSAGIGAATGTITAVA